MTRGATIAILAVLLVSSPLEARTRHKAADPKTETEHVVRSGESLILIARRAGVDQAAIIKTNDLRPPYHLRIGQKLAIPRARNHAVKRGETGYGIARQYGVDWNEIAKASGIDPRAALRPGETLTVPIGNAVAPAPSETETKPAPTRVRTHTVKPGDVGSRIASQYGVSWSEIARTNDINPGASLRPGQKLTIPGSGSSTTEPTAAKVPASPAPARTLTHTVRHGEIGSRIASRYGVAWADIARASGIGPHAPIRPGQKLTIPATGSASVGPPAPREQVPAATPTKIATPSPAASEAAKGEVQFQWPVDGPIRRGFVSRQEGASFHDGIDILADQGAKVHAAATGKVIYAADGPSDYGKTVIISHGHGWTSVYSFLSRIEVRVGQKVKAGKTIGRIGKTGVATEPQLHFEIRTYRRAIDPLGELPDRKD